METDSDKKQKLSYKGELGKERIWRNIVETNEIHKITKRPIQHFVELRIGNITKDIIFCI